MKNCFATASFDPPNPPSDSSAEKKEGKNLNFRGGPFFGYFGFHLSRASGEKKKKIRRKYPSTKITFFRRYIFSHVEKLAVNHPISRREKSKNANIRGRLVGTKRAKKHVHVLYTFSIDRVSAFRKTSRLPSLVARGRTKTPIYVEHLISNRYTPDPLRTNTLNVS